MLPFDDRDGYIWLDGDIVLWREAKSHVLSHALHYGSQVFEGERSYNGKIFKSNLHTKRLKKSCEYLDFKLPIIEEKVDQLKHDLLEKNNLIDAYVRPFCWRGADTMGVAANDTRIHMAISVWDWPSYFDFETKMKGIKLNISQWKRPSPASAPVHAKASGLYMICTLSKNMAERHGYQDSLMLDYRGYIAEATGANIFFVMKDNKIHSPIPDCFLNGITRQTIIEIAKKKNYDIIERHILPEEMSNAVECFLTGTAAEVTPVSQIDKYNFFPGDVTTQLIEEFNNFVNL